MKTMNNKYDGIMDSQKDIFKLGVFAGWALYEELLQNEKEIKSTYANTIEWQCQRAEELYELYKENLPEYFSLNKTKRI